MYIIKSGRGLGREKREDSIGSLGRDQSGICLLCALFLTILVFLYVIVSQCVFCVINIQIHICAAIFKFTSLPYLSKYSRLAEDVTEYVALLNDPYYY
jgi:hypothetical protein